MTYWTVMMITILSGDMVDVQSGIMYSSQAQCEAATSAVSATLDYDHNIECIVSTMASGSIRPMPRPEVEG